MVTINHPPYSLFHPPSDPLLFPEVKSALKGKRLQDVDIKINVTTKLNAFALDGFDNYFVQLLERCKKCVGVKEEYVISFLFASCASVLID
jgi:hypothetical protein